MIIYAVIIIILLVIAVGVGLNIRNYKSIQKKVSVAVDDFNIEEDSLTIIPVGSANLIIEKHLPLYNAVCGVRILFFFKKDSVVLSNFKRVYENYIQNIISHNKRVEDILYIIERLPLILEELNEFTKGFFAHNEWQYLKDKYGKLLNILKSLSLYRTSRHINYNECLHVVMMFQDESFRQSHNKRFVKDELVIQENFFNTILPYSLDNQQRDAIVKSEDNCLVISSAGSGKTSTIVGKAKYIIDKCNIDPSEILLISFTRKAAEELRERIGDDNITCATFHKLALDIVADYRNRRPSLCDNKNVFKIILEELLRDDSFKCAVLDLYTMGQLVLSHDYSSAQDYYREQKKYGNRALLPDMDGRAIYTKSLEEKTICFLLSSLGLKFRYEEPYEYLTSDKAYAQYKPDFSIYYKDAEGKTKRIYLEHFAINRNGQVPEWFAKENESWDEANKRYIDGIKWKRSLHNQKKTVLIETHSYEFHEDNVFDILKTELTKVGVPFRTVPTEELYTNVTTTNKRLQELALNLISSFVQLMKSNCKNIDSLIYEAKKKNDKRNKMIMSSVIKPFFEAYTKYLKERGELDFSDVIAIATDICSNNEQYRRYKYILVDEFQDISFDRYKFLQSLRSTELFTKFFCVGDDWQSIYRFTGSDMQLFTNFKDFFGCTEECRIETTYRFSEPIISISSNFIQTNPSQKRKTIRPFNQNNITELSFASYRSSQSHISKILCDILETIPENKSVYILGRYNFDIDNLDIDRRNDFYAPYGETLNKPIEIHQPQNRTPYITTPKTPNRKCKFFSVHSSKGLEADYVILINCNDGMYGFPATIEDDPVLVYVLSEQDHYTYAEERRLFYVAITRAKEHTYVIYDREHPSDFVMEIDGNKDSGCPVCPRCKNGNLETKRQGTTRYGNSFKWYCCSNSVCDYTITEFN